MSTTMRGVAGGAIKVLVAAQYLDPQVGGAERYADEVGKRLAVGGAFELSHIGSDAPGLSPPRIRAWTTGYNMAWTREVGAVLDRTDPDVVYVHHTVPGLTDVVLRQASARSIPVALMYHSDVAGPGWLKRLAGRAYQWAIGSDSLSVPAVIFVGAAAYATSSPIVRRTRARVVEAPPGVDPVMARGRRGDARRYILFVGKPNMPSKGLRVLVEAWRQIRADWPDHDLAVVGGREAAVSERDRVRRLGRVMSRQALADLYAGAAVTVMPSLAAESFGMVLAESLVAGSPIIASNIGGIPSLVEDHRNGRLVPPGDVTALGEALSEVLEHNVDYRGYVGAHKEAYVRRFNWEATAEIVGNALTELVTSASGGCHAMATS